MFRSPVSKCVSMNPLAKATDESPVARGLSTRALFIRDAIFATVWYRPSRAPQTPPVHPCTGGSPYQDLNKNPKKVLIFSFGFDVDLFRHVVLQPKRGMKARIRRQGCRRKNGGARMAIAVRSVKAGMTRFGYLRSRLKDGAKLGCRGAAIGPPTRTPARSACRFRCIRRTKPYTGTTSTTGVQNLAHQVIPPKTHS